MERVEEQQLLALLRLAMHPDEAVPVILQGQINWADVFAVSQKQSVIGIAMQGLKVWLKSEEKKEGVCKPERRLLLEWHGLAERVQKRNILLNEQSAFVVNAFKKSGFRSTIMKGQGNAWLYGNELGPLRLPGDIDVWVEGGFEKVYNLVQSVCPTKEVNELEMHFNIMKSTEVEVHYRPCIMRNPFKNRILQRFFERQAEACYKNEQMLEGCNQPTCIATLPFNLVHQLVHVHLHLFTEGIGLRQLMDYYYQLERAKESDVELDEVKATVKMLGLNRFAAALCWVLCEVFGLDEACCIWKPCASDGRFLLDEILRTGNFGHHDEENKARKKKTGFGLWNIFVRNLSLYRFDHWDWFWGPLWRIYHWCWRKLHGFK